MILSAETGGGATKLPLVKYLSWTACAVMVFLLSGCEATWGTPNEVTISPAGASKIHGIAEITISIARMNGRGNVGSEVLMQFTALHNAKKYVGKVLAGNCARPDRAIETMQFQELDDPTEGIQGGTHVDVPIHEFMHGGYALALFDRVSGRMLSCGDVTTDRSF